MGEKKNRYGVLVGNPTTRNHWQDQGIDGRIISKWILIIRIAGMDWIELAQGRDRWQSWLHKMQENYLTFCETVCCARRTVLHAAS